MPAASADAAARGDGDAGDAGDATGDAEDVATLALPPPAAPDGLWVNTSATARKRMPARRGLDFAARAVASERGGGGVFSTELAGGAGRYAASRGATSPPGTSGAADEAKARGDSTAFAGTRSAAQDGGGPAAGARDASAGDDAPNAAQGGEAARDPRGRSGSFKGFTERREELISLARQATVAWIDAELEAPPARITKAEVRALFPGTSPRRASRLDAVTPSFSARQTRQHGRRSSTARTLRVGQGGGAEGPHFDATASVLALLTHVVDDAPPGFLEPPPMVHADDESEGSSRGSAGPGDSAGGHAEAEAGAGDAAGSSSGAQPVPPDSDIGRFAATLKDPRGGSVLNLVKAFVTNVAKLPIDAILLNDPTDSDMEEEERMGEAAPLSRSARRATLKMEREAARAMAPDKSVDDVTPLSERARTFFTRVEDMMRQHPLWRVEEDWDAYDGPAEESKAWQSAVDGLESFVMCKLHRHLFARRKGAAAKDAALHERMARLSFLTFAHLDMPQPPASLEGGWRLAQQALAKIDDYKSPAHKMACIMNSCRVISTLLTQMGKEGAGVGADEFLPALIYTVLHANPRTLYSSLQFIGEFRHPGMLMSEEGYFFTNVLSAVSFAKSVSARQLSITADEFDSRFNATASGLSPPLGPAAGATSPKAKSHVGQRLSEAQAAAEEIRREKVATGLEVAQRTRADSSGALEIDDFILSPDGSQAAGRHGVGGTLGPVAESGAESPRRARRASSTGSVPRRARRGSSEHDGRRHLGGLVGAAATAAAGAAAAGVAVDGSADAHASRGDTDSSWAEASSELASFFAVLEGGGSLAAGMFAYSDGDSSGGSGDADSAGEGAGDAGKSVVAGERALASLFTEEAGTGGVGPAVGAALRVIDTFGVDALSVDVKRRLADPEETSAVYNLLVAALRSAQAGCSPVVTVEAGPGIPLSGPPHDAWRDDAASARHLDATADYFDWDVPAGSSEHGAAESPREEEETVAATAALREEFGACTAATFPLAQLPALLADYRRLCATVESLLLGHVAVKDETAKAPPQAPAAPRSRPGSPARARGGAGGSSGEAATHATPPEPLTAIDVSEAPLGV